LGRKTRRGRFLGTKFSGKSILILSFGLDIVYWVLDCICMVGLGECASGVDVVLNLSSDRSNYPRLRLLSFVNIKIGLWLRGLFHYVFPFVISFFISFFLLKVGIAQSFGYTTFD